jgi:hypothetical protein
LVDIARPSGHIGYKNKNLFVAITTTGTVLVENFIDSHNLPRKRERDWNGLLVWHTGRRFISLGFWERLQLCVERRLSPYSQRRNEREKCAREERKVDGLVSWIDFPFLTIFSSRLGGLGTIAV